MMMNGLTSRQRDALQFISCHIAEHGKSPSYREIGEALRLKGIARVSELVAALVERGAITRLPYKARSIALCHPHNPPPGYTLPSRLQLHLSLYCSTTGERPADVIADALALFLDGVRPGDATATGLDITEAGRAALALAATADAMEEAT